MQRKTATGAIAGVVGAGALAVATLTNGQEKPQPATKATVMVECAYVYNPDDTIREYDMFQNECPIDPAGKDFRWIPVVGTQPGYDPKTQVLEGPTIDVQPTQVVRSWNVRDKTAQELDASKQAQIDSLQPPIKDALCDQHSAISALEGAGTKTAAECDAWLKDFLQ